ncbi:MAG: Hpt domain-containing protein, partial [Lachnospiraceae bacterium]|nr:Hpt domain-containing protein [Lachnospiraceae bacterium]
WLSDLPDVDVKTGIKNCASIDGYLSVLSVFHQTAKDKADEIENLFLKGDIENYTIKVHALKSSARILGASSLSGLAADLEDAGKRKDTEYIKDNGGKLLKMYRDLDAGLSRLDRADDNLQRIEAGAMKEAYQTISEIAQSMDYELMDDMLKNLHVYDLLEADRQRVAEIERKLADLDWDGIIQITGEVL